jgi:hypothetical protein
MERLNSISRFIGAVAALIAALTLAWFVYRLIDFDHHPRLNVLHSYDHTIYVRPPGLDQPVEPQMNQNVKASDTISRK